MPENEARSVYKVPPELTPYLREMSAVLGHQARALSVGGMSWGRSGLSVIQGLSYDVIRLIADKEEDLCGDEPEKPVNVYEYLDQVEARLSSGELKPPALQINDHAKELLTTLRVTYCFAQVLADKKRDGLSFSDTSIGLPVMIVATMLDPLVDQQKVKKAWQRISQSDRKTEDFIRDFEFRISRVLYQI